MNEIEQLVSSKDKFYCGVEDVKLCPTVCRVPMMLYCISGRPPLQYLGLYIFIHLLKIGALKHGDSIPESFSSQHYIIKLGLQFTGTVFC